jgi:hypothetical protein
MNSVDKINTVAGLSDLILSGLSRAQNVQTPEWDKMSHEEGHCQLAIANRAADGARIRM